MTKVFMYMLVQLVFLQNIHFFKNQFNVVYSDAFFCRPDEFICNNTLCKLHVWVCDGEDDCGDNSDEDPEMCGRIFNSRIGII